MSTSTATLQFIHLAMDVQAHSLWEFQDQIEWTGQVQLPTMVQVCLLRQVPLHYLHTIRANQANVEGQEAQIISLRSSWNIVNALYRLFETLRGCFSVVEAGASHEEPRGPNGTNVNNNNSNDGGRGLEDGENGGGDTGNCHSNNASIPGMPPVGTMKNYEEPLQSIISQTQNLVGLDWMTH